ESHPEKQTSEKEQSGKKSFVPVLKIESISTGDVFHVAITDIQNPGTFFCQKLQYAKKLAELMESMNNHYKQAPPSPGFSPVAGEICCAQFKEDNCWYRATVLNRDSQDSALVGYVDYGNVEHLQISRLRPIPASMLEFPLQAIHCKLAGVRPLDKTWSKEATAAMTSFVANKIITVRVVGQTEQQLQVELLDGSVNPELNISKRLIETGFAVEEGSGHVEINGLNKTNHSEGADAKTWKWVELPYGQTVEACVCMLYSPGKFYCQLYNEKDLKSLEQLNKSLGQYCMQNTAGKCDPKAGDMCCAFFSSDGNWYRAIVKDVNQDKTYKVLFVDYGNIEQVTADKLCDIAPTFMELPFQAIKCCLAGVKPVGEEWNKEATLTFQTHVAGLKLKAKAVGKNAKSYCVELMTGDPESSISEVLVTERKALRDAPQIPGGPAGNHHSSMPKPTKKAGENSSKCAVNGSSPTARMPALSPESKEPREPFRTIAPPPIDLPPSFKIPPRENTSCNANKPRARTEDKEHKQWKSVELPLGQAVEACVCMFYSPGEFYCQLFNEKGTKWQP
ncbi:hypothetical protein GDO86_017941, partial [Hymenochirus boettgeri]